MQENKALMIKIECYPDNNLFKQEQDFLKLRLLGIDSLFLYDIDHQ